MTSLTLLAFSPNVNNLSSFCFSKLLFQYFRISAEGYLNEVLKDTLAKGFINAMGTVAGWHENQPLQLSGFYTMNIR